MKIGNVELNTKIVLAPMAGVTDVAFRTVCRELSGCYTVTEMVSAKALCYGDKKTSSLLTLGEGEHPCGVQIFGSDEAAMENMAASSLYGIIVRQEYVFRTEPVSDNHLCLLDSSFSRSEIDNPL